MLLGPSPVDVTHNHTQLFTQREIAIIIIKTVGSHSYLSHEVHGRDSCWRSCDKSDAYGGDDVDVNVDVNVNT